VDQPVRLARIGVYGLTQQVGITGVLRGGAGGRESPMQPHTLRHTEATWLLNAGVDIATIKYLGGWRSSSVLLDTYLHSRKDIN